ncbi:MAG: type II toxin-antitoxin system RelE/ParE family toxin [Methylococcaceae bacterium]
MTYKLRFHELALTEWNKLDGSIKSQFKKKLAERLEQPRLKSSALSGMKDCYKIKPRQPGYRIVYRVDDDIVSVTVIAAGKRNKEKVYQDAEKRI